MLNPKQTRWKKSRKFGDVFGGRRYPKIADKVFNRAHSLTKPNFTDTLPIFLKDNPSKDMYFPVNSQEVSSALSNLPEADTAGLTHVWLRRAKPGDFEKELIPFAEYICGSGVYLIVLYPWPRNMLLPLSKRPTAAKLKRYQRWAPELVYSKNLWHLKWQPEAVKDFYLSDLIPHEIAHHVDYQQRHWSKANTRQREEFAIQYANQRYFEGSEAVI